MLTIALLLVLAAFVVVVLSAVRGPAVAPLWIAVLLLVIERLLGLLPLR
jgi:hypothetical protein